LISKGEFIVNVSRQIALSMALSLLLPGLALAASGSGSPSAASSPTQLSQTLPPLQGGGYSNPAYTPAYGSTPSYSQVPAYTPSQQYAPQYGGVQPQYGAQQPQYTPQYSQQPSYQQAPLQGYIVSAPAGTVVSATVSSPISSELARVGDRFNVTLGSPLVSGNNVILPAGSQMEGQVMMVKAAGHTGRPGELDIRFTSATLPNGQRVPLSARIQTEDGTGIIKGGTNVNRLGRAAVNTGVSAGLGAALGTAMGPLSGGGVGRGAIYGTVLGAGMGALGSAWQKGKPATIDTSAPVNVVLDQPLTATPAVSGSSYSQPADSGYYGGQSNFQPYGTQQTPQPSNFYGGQ
jgi:hypothetical protein